MSDHISPYVRVVVVVDQGRSRNPLYHFARVDTITSDNEVARQRATAVTNTARAAGQDLPELAATQTSWVVPLPADVLKLIADLTDPDPCTYDHHGYCTAHRWTDTSPACPHARAQTLIAAARKEGMIDG